MISVLFQRILTATRFDTALLEILANIFDPTQILPAHRDLFLQGLAYNDRGLPLFNAWIQFESNFALMVASVPNVGRVLSLTLGFNTQQADIDQLTAFMAAQTVSTAVRNSINNGLATARGNVAWLAVHLQPITQYLQSGVWRTQS